MKLIKFEMNKIIEILIQGNIIITGAWGFINPFFAVFATRQIIDGNLIVVGNAVAIYWIVKSILQMPIAKLLDNLPSEDDDAFALTIGSFLVSIVPFCFLFSTKAIHIYFLHAILAFGDALRVTSWNAIFTRHIDRGKENIEWGINSTVVGFILAITTLAGGWIAEKFGFQAIFFFSGLISILGSFFFLTLSNYIRKMPGGKKSFKELIDYFKDGIMGGKSV